MNHAAYPRVNDAQRAALFDLLVESSTDFAIFLLDAEGKVATWNEGARCILGYDEAEIVGQSFDVFYLPEDRTQGTPARLLQIAREQGKALNERWHVRKDGSLFYASGIDQVLRNEMGEVVGFSIIFRDQTKPHLLQTALRASEERFRRMVENVTDYALFTLDADGCIDDWNTGAERILGYAAEEIVGQPSSRLFTPEDVAQGEARKELEQAAREGRAEDERWHARKDGSRFFASGILMRMQNVDSPRFIKVLRDMTAQKHAEELRLQQQGRIAVLEERQRIAQELHDTLAQSFTGIALQLSAANDVLESESERARAHITRAQTIARESLQESRRVVQALRPTLLQTQGLPQALAQLIEKATTGAAVEGMCHIEGTSRPLLPRIEEDLLRIAQEAVTNALRHSQGTQVRVTLRYEPNRLLLTVSDNGQGFDVQATAPAGHFGLKGIGERVERMGGQLTLHSEEGHGTELGVIFTSP